MPSRIPVSSLSRLMHRPSHKTNRSKFDPTSENAQKHRENPVLTQEDSRGTEDALWIHSLRPLIPQKKFGERDQKRGNESADEGQEEDNKGADEVNSLGPPSFCDRDVEKWQAKFKTARDARIQEKATMKSMGCFKPYTTKNINV